MIFLKMPKSQFFRETPGFCRAPHLAYIISENLKLDYHDLLQASSEVNIIVRGCVNTYALSGLRA